MISDLASSFELSFLNKCDETEKPIISEYLQRCFDIEIDDSVSNLVDQDWTTNLENKLLKMPFLLRQGQFLKKKSLKLLLEWILFQETLFLRFPLLKKI